MLAWWCVGFCDVCDEELLRRNVGISLGGILQLSNFFLSSQSLPNFSQHRVEMHRVSGERQSSPYHMSGVLREICNHHLERLILDVAFLPIFINALTEAPFPFLCELLVHSEFKQRIRQADIFAFLTHWRRRTPCLHWSRFVLGYIGRWVRVRPSSMLSQEGPAESFLQAPQ